MTELRWNESCAFVHFGVDVPELVRTNRAIFAILNVPAMITFIKVYDVLRRYPQICD